MEPLFIVIPTLNERDGLTKILPLRGGDHVIIVDDGSTDGTVDLVQKFQSAVLIRRVGKRGIVSAFIDGMKEALSMGAQYIMVMDGDGQHDPRFLEAMYKSAVERGTDLLLGSRYIAGGKDEGFSSFRRLVSKGANYLFTVSMGGHVHDATTGYRVYSRRAAEYLVENRPRNESYAGQIEIVKMLHDAGMSIEEFPITFEPRSGGNSKLKFRDMLDFFAYILRGGNLWKYTIVGAGGIVVNELALFLLAPFLNVLLADIIAIELSIVMNFIFNEWWTFSNLRLEKGSKGVFKRFYKNNLASIVGVLINFGIFAILAAYGMQILLANIIGIVVAFVFRYIVSALAVWVE
jgi:dolichol-phosphate mannosyltransferase